MSFAGFWGFARDREAYREDLENGDPHEEIVHLEEQIDELAAKIESCRKFILASRIAVAGGGVVLAAMLVGAIRSDLGLMAAAVASLLGGIVVWGSNSSTAKEAAKELAAAESERAALIAHINPGVISAKTCASACGNVENLRARQRDRKSLQRL